MVPGHLRPTRGRHDLLANLDHRCRQVMPLDAHALDECGREGRVAPLAVERDVTGLRRVGDEGAEPGRCRRKAAADPGRASPHRASEIARERIVAAGVEDDDRRLALALDLHLAQYEFEFHRLELEVALALELGVDRHQVALQADLQPVSRVEEERDVGIGELVGEDPHGAVELAPVGIERLDDIESDGLQRRRHVAGVVQRVGERRGALIGAVADDQRNARLGKGGRDSPIRARKEQRTRPATGA